MTGEVINRTTAFCGLCQSQHPARYERRANDVFFAADCPREDCDYRVTDDAELFLALRSKCNFDFSAPSPHGAYRHVNLVEVTRSCNFSCRFCYAGSPGRSSDEEISVDEVLSIARRVKAEGGYAVQLTGGEALLHPKVFEMIRSIRALGLGVSLATNGYLLGTQSGLALELKRAGVTIVAIQFDTLDPDTHQIYRGNTFVQEKLQAFDACRKVGLRSTATAVVTTHNLEQLGGLLDALLSFAPSMFMISLQCFWPSPGSSADFGPDARVYKEGIVKALCRQSGRIGLRPEHFWPIPSFAPLRLNIHPDCGLVAAVCSTGDGWIPADDWVDASKLNQRMASAQGEFRNVFLSTAQLVRLTLASTRKGKRMAVMKSIWGSLSGRGKPRAVLLAIESLMEGPLQDEQRACRCGSVLRTLQGDGQTGCFANRVPASEVRVAC